MDEFLLFVEENYIWFIVIGVLLVMAFIGFIAEKTDFGNKISIKKKEKPVKEEKEKKVKPEKEKKNKKEKKNDNILGLEEDTNEVDGEGLDLNSMGLSSLLDENNSSEESNTFNANESEDLSVPFGDDNIQNNDNAEISEDLTVPFGDDNVIDGIEEPEKEAVSEEIVPEIEEPKETEEVTNDEDDVWKF